MVLYYFNILLFLISSVNGCNSGWGFFNGYCYYSNSNVMSFSEARSYCRERNSTLTSIQSKEEEQFIHSLISKDNGYWIGLNNVGLNTERRWTDGTTVEYVNLGIQELPTYNEGTCLSLNLTKNNGWIPELCMAFKGAVCKGPDQNTTHRHDVRRRIGRATWHLPPGLIPKETFYRIFDTIQNTGKIVGCLKHEVGYRNSCYHYINSPTTWEDAKDICGHTGGSQAHIITINDYIESRFIKKLLRGLSAPPWIGIKFNETEDNSSSPSVVKWITGETMNFTNWHFSNPNTSVGDCVKIATEFNRLGEWTSEDCNQNLTIICESPRDQHNALIETTLADPCGNGWTKYDKNEYCYKAFRKGTWTYAEATCVSHGGHLVTWSDREEQAFTKDVMHSNFTTAANKAWIGLKAVDDGHEWVDGTTMEYVDWGYGQPDNYLGREQCGSMSLITSTMFDSVCHIELPFICKVKLEEIKLKPATSPSPEFSYELCYEDEDWLLFNNSCYLFVSDDKLSFWESSQSCMNEGGHLASILSYEENYWIFSKISEREKSYYWIGGHTNFQSSWNYWTDGSAMQFFNWDIDEPNHADDQEDCITILSKTFGSGYWNDDNCSVKHKRICKKPFNQTSTTTPFIKTTTTSLPKAVGCSGDDWHLIGSKCVKLFRNATLNWFDAREVCKNASGNLSDLVSIHSAAENAALVALGGSDLDAAVWIGMRYINTFRWVDQTELNYLNWGYGEPNSKLGTRTGRYNFCVEMVLDSGKFNDHHCVDKGPFICQKSPDLLDSTIEPTDNLERCESPYQSYYKYGKHCFNVVNEAMSWQDAEERCRKEKSDLASVHNFREMSYLWFLSERQSLDNVYIGLNNIKNNHQFVWSDDWPVLFTNWDRNEPNPSTADQNCVNMNITTGLWRSISCATKQPFACKFHNGTIATPDPPIDGYCPDNEWVDFKGSFCYLFYTEKKLSWREANMNCLRRGGALVSIHNSIEMDWIFKATQNMIFSSWIGLIYQTHDYGWSDGTPYDYMNWDKGEPNGVYEHCVEVLSTGLWNDNNCNNPRHSICKIRKVPNATETTTVSISTFLPHRTEITGGITSSIVLGILLVAVVICFIGFIQYKEYSLRQSVDNKYSFENVLYNPSPEGQKSPDNASITMYKDKSSSTNS